MSNIKMLKTIIYVNSINNLVSIMETQCPWQSRDWIFYYYRYAKKYFQLPASNASSVSCL